ncbi:MAG: glycine--tRNA ligase subunit beta, partial [Rhodospirillales bacterium]|nr:glycine--tRNA ligase subunit beta [Rhodospirillales bacterium]
SWPKSMRWDESGVRWVRPIRSILCLLDDAVVPFRFGTVESGRTTLGHPFLSSGPLTIENPCSYEATLESARVMLDPEQRKQRIEGDALALAEGAGYSLARDAWLVTENAGLVEWPVVLMGTIDEPFMELPDLILRSAMRTHQRYFSVLGRRKGGRLAPRFVMVSDADIIGGGAVVAGNERVLRARLADARFFWNQDGLRRLDDRVGELKGMVFHARLGSMYEKAKRIENLARVLCQWVEDADPDDAARAGLLCKADLVTETVGEFPDLQGIMGGNLGEADGEPTSVWIAILQHHRPEGPDAICPERPVSVAVALADKLDTLVGFFAIDERPTGSKDPFALRRTALGAIRIIIENDLRLPLGDAFGEAISGYGGLLPAEPGPEATRAALLAFLADRVRVHLREKGYRHDLVSAVFGASGEDDLVRLVARVKALGRFLESEDGANLLTAYRRAANILRIEEKKDGTRYDGEADTDLFGDPDDEEYALHSSIAVANTIVEPALERGSFEEAMEAMAALRAPVDAFFDQVTVNCDEPDLRHNRLLMLSQIRSTLDRVADFSKIEG